MATARKCENWIKSFIEWVSPRSEAPENYIMWTALFTLATAVRRRVFIGEKYLGGWRCYPHLYILFVGPPGMRKTVTIAKAQDLLDQVGSLKAAPTNTSQAALSVRMLEADEHAIYIVGEEFGDLFLKSGTEMYEFLTSAFDAKRRLEVATIARGTEYLENPCINMLAGTTPKWISENMPESVIGGGFAARVLFIYEDTLRQKKFFYNEEGVDFTAIEQQRQELATDLVHIANNLTGEFSLTKEAQGFLEHWYQEHEPKKMHPKVRGYYARKHVHLLKLMMTIHLSYSDELELNLEDAHKALALLNLIEPKLLTVFEGIGKNQYTFDMNDILEYITKNKPVSKKALLRQFMSVATPNLLLELIGGLISMNRIKSEIKDDDVYYHPTQV
jgi:hypothetical protein